MKNTNLAFMLITLLPVLLISGCVQTGTTAGTGSTVFTLTDAAANLSSVSSVTVTIDSVQAHSNATGWITVSSTPQTYDLLQLKASAKQVVLSNATLQAGTYEQVRLYISKVVVTDSQGQHDAKLPSNDLKLVGQIVVDVNKTSAVTFDFVADESLHVTGNGQYIMAPVIHLTTQRNADVSIRADNTAEIRSGSTVTDEKVGTDVNGNVGVGLSIPANANLSISGNGAIQVAGLVR